MMSDYLAPIADHLWQSTLFAAVAGLLTLTLRNNRAAVRYNLWLAASAKFLIPFSLFVALGRQLAWHPATVIDPAAWPLAIDEVIAPPVIQAAAAAPAMASMASLIPALILAVWAIGFAVVLFSWWRAWQPIRAALRHATPLRLDALRLDASMDVRSSLDLLEPAAVGVLRPVLLLPDGIADRLQPSELQAILVHELCHIRRRDNLAAMMHMLVEALFWFHPLVWWLEARLVDERERACDEEVLRSGNDPAVYAESILKICRLYALSPLACASGVSGANLKKRVEEIVANRMSVRVSAVKRTVLVATAAAVIALPLASGSFAAPRMRSVCDATQPNLTPTTRYVINGDEVTDKETSLTWQRCSIGQQWKDGSGCVGAVRSLSRGDAWSEVRERESAGWRLPTRDELLTLASPSCKNPAINEAVFPDMDLHNLWYWTSTPSGVSGRWTVVGFDRAGGNTGNGTSSFPVRLVRAEARTSADAPRSPEETAQMLVEQQRPRIAVPFDFQDFDKYVGFYLTGPNPVGAEGFFTVSRQGEHFFFEVVSAKANVEILPESPTKFFIKDPKDIGPLQISFVTDAQGKTAGLVLHEQGREEPARKVEESIFRAAQVAFADHIKNQTSSPGTEAALRRIIEALEKGQPNYADMTPLLATVVRAKIALPNDNLKNWGALKYLTFTGVTNNGLDKYQVVFERNNGQMVISPLTADGKVGAIGGDLMTDLTRSP